MIYPYTCCLTPLGVTSSALGSLKGVQILGLTSQLSKVIQGLRVEEISAAHSVSLLGAASMTICMYVPDLS